MYPEDRVLIGVINRRVDFELARDQGWYRIPVESAPKYIDSEYIAFYFSRNFEAKNGGIHYYAKQTGHELVRRRDLLPNEQGHPRADKLYYRISLGKLQEKTPPILNPTARPIVFVFTTWDRFVTASTIADLYSTSEFYVDRVSKVLNQKGVPVDSSALWQDDELKTKIADLRRRLEILLARTDLSESEQGERALKEAISALGGLKFLDIPFDT
jgi:hypothetical protein